MKKRNFLAAITAVAVAASMFSAAAMNVSAANAYTPINGTTTTFDKYLVMKKDANVPNATFSFSINAGAAIPADTKNGKLAVLAGVGTPTIADTTFKSDDKTVAEDDDSAEKAVIFATPDDKTDEKYAKKTLTVDFSSVNFNEPGVYRYVITEKGVVEGVTNQGVTNDAVAKRTLDVYVEDENGTLKVAGYVMYSGEITEAPLATKTDEDDDTAAGTKSSSYTNTYATQNLTFGKEVTGNQGSKDKYFEFTVNISGAVAGTKYVVDATSHADADQNDNIKEITVGNDGTVETKFYLQDGQYITIFGLANDTVYSVTENAEDYTSSEGILEAYSTLNWDNNDGYDALTDAVSGTINGADIHTGYTNDRSGTIPTGVILSVAAPVVIGLAVLGGIVFLVIKNKKRESEEEE